MEVKKLSFTPSREILQLIDELENCMGCEVALKKDIFPVDDEGASAKGGFEKWHPHVTINPERRTEFNEEALLHELLHIKRFLNGAFVLGIKDEFYPKRDADANNRISFVRDVTNQIEHVAIFPILEKHGFDSHIMADRWKTTQITQLKNTHPQMWGPLSHAHTCIKIGVGENIGKNKELQKAYIDSFAQIDQTVRVPGIEIGQILAIWVPKANHPDSSKRDYDYRRLYQRILSRAGVPRDSLLFLKKLSFDTKTEHHLSIW